MLALPEQTSFEAYDRTSATISCDQLK